MVKFIAQNQLRGQAFVAGKCMAGAKCVRFLLARQTQMIIGGECGCAARAPVLRAPKHLRIAHCAQAAGIIGARAVVAAQHAAANPMREQVDGACFEGVASC